MPPPPVPPNPYRSPQGQPGYGRRPMVSAAQIYRRPGLVTVLAVLNFIGAPMSLLLAVFLNYAAGQGEPDAALFLRVFAFVYVIFGFIGFFTGIGLWGLKGYGRKLQIVSSVFGLLGIPLGTVISAAILWYLFKPGVKALFSEKPVARLTAFEIGEIQKLQQSSAGLVIVLAILIPVVLVAFIGIVAAIAIPSLLRARVSANEARAIGTLREVISAEVTYAAANGGHYDQLACLENPYECLPTYAPEAPRFMDTVPVGTISGYTYEFHPGEPADETDVAFGNLSRSSIKSFVLVATPAEPGLTGTRGFCADYTGQICMTVDGSTPAVANGMCSADCTPLQ